MGLGLVNEEASRVEHSIVLFVIAAVTVHAISTYSSTNVDTTAFAVFAAMCFAGYFALKAAQEIVSAIEERKQAAYEALKADMYVITGHTSAVAPVAFGNTSRYSKYATSTYSMV